MAKGPIVSEKVQEMIAEVCAAHTDWPAKRVKDEVASRLQNDPDSSARHLRMPGLSYVQKKLQEVKLNLASRPPEVAELDRPFTLAALDKHPIPPEALPAVLRVWQQSIDGAEGIPDSDKQKYDCACESMGVPQLRPYYPDRPMTVRMALWAARLSYVLRDPSSLRFMAGAYAQLQLIAEARGRTLDTRDYDEALLRLQRIEAFGPEERALWDAADHKFKNGTKEQKQEWVQRQLLSKKMTGSFGQHPVRDREAYDPSSSGQDSEPSRAAMQEE